MRYLQAYRFAFQGPDWPMNLLYLSVCPLVPVVGPIVMYGYLASMVEAMHREGEQARPPFDFNGLLNYLIRGAWLFLAMLVCSLALIPVFFICIGLPVAGIFLFRQNPVLLTASIILTALMYLLTTVAMALVMHPIMLRAGLTQDFKAAFDKDFIVDFIRRTWRETALAQLFMIVTSLPLAVLGYLICCIGIYPAIAIIGFAQWHLLYQAYELHLQRGGAEIPLKPVMAEAPQLPPSSRTPGSAEC